MNKSIEYSYLYICALLLFTKGKYEGGNYVRKGMIACATVMMLFTSTFSSASTVHASNEKVYFEVNKADEVLNEAKGYLGKPYVWGAAGPNSFDCSGFVSYVFKQVGLRFNADRFTTYSIEGYLDSLGVISYTYNTSVIIQKKSFLYRQKNIF